MQCNQRSRLRLPSAVNLYLTYWCRSQCAHCFLVQTGKIDRHQLSRETLFSVIDQLSEHHVYLLILSGGEPLLHPHFFDVVRYAGEKRLLPLVAITGTHVTDEDIARYASCGIPTIQMSLDGTSPETNDRIRGSGSFVDVMSAVRRFKLAGINVNLAICLHRDNAAETEGFFDLRLRLSAYRVKLAFYRQFSPGFPVHELDLQETLEVLECTRNFITAHDRPTVDIWTGDKILPRSGLPPLTIGADGAITAGDGGAEIGVLDEVPIAEKYSAYVDEKIHGFYEASLRTAFDEYGLSDVTEVDSLGANALVFKSDDMFAAYVDKGLPPAIKFFSLLHEVGHLATGTLQRTPRSALNENNERAANLWALNRLRPNLRPDAFSHYEQEMNRSEDAFYRHLAKHLENDLIRYF